MSVDFAKGSSFRRSLVVSEHGIADMNGRSFRIEIEISRMLKLWSFPEWAASTCCRIHLRDGETGANEEYEKGTREVRCS